MMDNSLRTIVALIISLYLGIDAANAGVSNEQTVNYQYYFPDSTITYPNASYGNYLVDSNVKVSDVTGDFDIAGFNRNNSIIFLTSRSSLNTTLSNGSIIDDISPTMNLSKLLNLKSHTDILETHNLSSGADHLYIEWQDFNPGKNDQVFTANPDNTNQIPEPENYAVLIIGLGLVGYTMRRRSIVG